MAFPLALACLAGCGGKEPAATAPPSEHVPGVIGFPAGVNCAPPRLPSSDGHSADYDCMSSGCHEPGTAVAGLLITVSGTLHSDGAGGAPVAGATVVVTDSAGNTVELVTSANGIFWSGSSNGTVVTPAGPQGTCGGGSCGSFAAAGRLSSVSVSMCPLSERTCANPGSGRCAACHTAGQPSQQSVHLP